MHEHHCTATVCTSAVARAPLQPGEKPRESGAAVRIGQGEAYGEGMDLVEHCPASSPTPSSARAPVAALLTAAPGRGAPGSLTRLALVDALCLSAATPAQALSLACTASPLWSSVPARVDALGGLTRVCCAASGAACPAALATACAARVRLWSRLVDAVALARIEPVGVELPDLPAEQQRELRASLGRVVRFGGGELAVEFRSSELEQRNPGADPALVALLRRHLDDRLAQHWHDQGMAERLRQHLRSLDDLGATGTEACARALGVGVRTLHRRLRAEGTSYREVLREFRLRRCAEQLERATVSGKEMASELGFASPASFHRAFRRWTGHTVGEYRRSCAVPVPHGAASADPQESRS